MKSLGLLFLFLTALLFGQSSLVVTVNNTTNVLTIGTCSVAAPCPIMVFTAGSGGGLHNITGPWRAGPPPWAIR